MPRSGGTGAPLRREGAGKSARHLWLKNNRASLTASGIPFPLIENERTWNYIVLHGDDLQTGWNASALSQAQASRVLSLISRSPFKDDASELIRVLNMRIRHGPAW